MVVSMSSWSSLCRDLRGTKLDRCFGSLDETDHNPPFLPTVSPKTDQALGSKLIWSEEEVSEEPQLKS